MKKITILFIFEFLIAFIHTLIIDFQQGIDFNYYFRPFITIPLISLVISFLLYKVRKQNTYQYYLSKVLLFYCNKLY